MSPITLFLFLLAAAVLGGLMARNPSGVWAVLLIGVQLLFLSLTLIIALIGVAVFVYAASTKNHEALIPAGICFAPLAGYMLWTTWRNELEARSYGRPTPWLQVFGLTREPQPADTAPRMPDLTPRQIITTVVGSILVLGAVVLIRLWLY